MISSTFVLITGANGGVGFDTARQLALKDSTAKVILGKKK
jgi:NAD(P)-dependent dehydrogenase (short-subunit alcohol dehydrogenase family)